MNAVDKLYRRTADGIKPGLEVINTLLDELDTPHHKFVSIHVAGTNGKGSVCAMIESVLRVSGFKTGLFTSPHLINFSERYRVNGKSISSKKLNRYILQLDKLADQISNKKELRRATFFELSTLIAFQYFADEKVDIAIIETGMGGRLDATNVLYPLLSVVTPISMDHTEFLGNSLKDIAFEKAGILKQGRPAISSDQPLDVKNVLQSKHQDIHFVNEHIFLQKVGRPQKLKIETPARSLPPINLSLLGPVQRDNAALAVGALEQVADILHFEPNFKMGLENVEWPGRFMEVSENPKIIYDGAHNPASATALKETIKDCYPDYEVSFIFGFLEDKDISNFCKNLKSIVSEAWTVSLDCHRGLNAELSTQYASIGGVKTEPLELIEAYEKAKNWAGVLGTNRIIIITGSLYLAELCVSDGIFSHSIFS